MRKQVLVVMAVLILLLGGLAPVMAQTDPEWVPFEEWKEAMIAHVQIVLKDQHSLDELNKMTQEQWQAMYDNFPKKKTFVDTVNKILTTLAGQSGSQP